MRVVVNSENTIYVDNGTPLFALEEYELDATDLINSYISSGLLITEDSAPVVEDPAPVAEKVTEEAPKKSISNKTTRAQETVVDKTEENSNG
jgi:hypothetical protein